MGNLRQTITTTTCRQPDIWLMCEMFADSGAFEYVAGGASLAARYCMQCMTLLGVMLSRKSIL